MSTHFTLAAARLGAVLVSTLLLSGLAAAGTIDIDSIPGLATNLPAFPTTVAITPHPDWQPNNPINPGTNLPSSAVWISYAATGYGDSHFQTYSGTTPVVSIFTNFMSGDGLLDLKVWADDSADVILDGSYLKHAVFTQSTCSGQPIGCRPQDFELFSKPLAAGSHTLEFVLYQVGTGTDTISNPMGLLFTGTASSAVPEPGVLSLVGMGLVGLGLLRRRTSQRSSNNSR
jgi:hypothetical protein